MVASFRAPVCFMNFGLIPDRHRYCTYLYYSGLGWRVEGLGRTNKTRIYKGNTGGGGRVWGLGIRGRYIDLHGGV